MEIQITEAKKTEHGFYFAASCGKTSAQVNVWKDGSVWAVCSSVVTARRMSLGKSFRSVGEAREAYKSPAMRAIISAASEASLSIAA